MICFGDHRNVLGDKMLWDRTFIFLPNFTVMQIHSITSLLCEDKVYGMVFHKLYCKKVMLTHTISVVQTVKRRILYMSMHWQSLSLFTRGHPEVINTHNIRQWPSRDLLCDQSTKKPVCASSLELSGFHFIVFSFHNVTGRTHSQWKHQCTF